MLFKITYTYMILRLAIYIFTSPDSLLWMLDIIDFTDEAVS